MADRDTVALVSRVIRGLRSPQRSLPPSPPPTRTRIGPQSVVGLPTTVFHAPSLSQAGILQSLRSGRVFIDLGDRRGRLLDVSAPAGDVMATIGGVLHVPTGDHPPVVVTAQVAGVAAATSRSSRPGTR